VISWQVLVHDSSPEPSIYIETEHSHVTLLILKVAVLIYCINQQNHVTLYFSE